MAKEKCQGFLETVCKDLIAVIESEIEYSRESMLKMLRNLIEKTQNSIVNYSDNIIKCLIILSADLGANLEICLTDRDQKCEITSSILFQLSTVTGAKLKIRALKASLSSFIILGDILPYYITYNSSEICKILKKISTISQRDMMETELVNAIDYVERDQECFEKLNCLIETSVKFEVFDILYEEQSGLLKTFNKTKDVSLLEDLFKIAYLFSVNWIQNSIFILKEALQLDCDSPYYFFSKRLLLNLTIDLYNKKEIELLELFENFMLIYDKNTRESCNQFLKTVSLEKNQQGIIGLIDIVYSELKASTLANLKVFGINQTRFGVLFLLDNYDKVDFLTETIPVILKKFDVTYKEMSTREKLNHVRFFSKLIPHISKFQESGKINNANLIRSILMRIRSFLASKMNEQENRKLVMASIQFYIDSIPCLNNKPIEIDTLDKSSFVIEEESNVSIPNALTEVTYEYLPAFVYCLKSLADSNCLGISLAILDLFLRISKLAPDFFLTEDRFRVKIFPFLKVILKQPHSNQAYRVKLDQKIVEFIKSIDLKCLSAIKNDLNECASIMTRVLIAEIQVIGEELKELIDKIY